MSPWPVPAPFPALAPLGFPGQGIQERPSPSEHSRVSGAGVGSRRLLCSPTLLPIRSPSSGRSGTGLPAAAAWCQRSMFSHSRPYQSDPSFDPEFIMSKSTAAAGLCSWCLNIVRFYEVFCEVEPKRQALEEANAELAEAQEKLSRIKSKIAVSACPPVQTLARASCGSQPLFSLADTRCDPISNSAAGHSQKSKRSEKDSYNSYNLKPRCKSCVTATGAVAKLPPVCRALSWPGSLLQLCCMQEVTVDVLSFEGPECQFGSSHCRI